MDPELVQEAIEDCQNAMPASNCPFTKWECDFIDSVAEQFEARGRLSEKQRETLQSIWDKV